MTTIAKKALTLTRPALFVPSTVKEMTNGASTAVTTFSDIVDTNIESSASFRYDPPGAGLRSTQQLNVDFSRFENHTFFNSAEVNVNVAFDKIINEYPFDGTRREVEQFFDSMTGFEKYVYDSFPKNKGYLLFSGSGAPGQGTFISVKDVAGTELPTISKNKSGDAILDPGVRPLTFEMHLMVPDDANGNNVVLQKVSGTASGVTLCVLSSTLASTTAQLVFTVASGTAVMNASASLSKGAFNHVVASFDRRMGYNKLLMYVNESLVDETQTSVEFGNIDFKNSTFNIGSGSTYVTSSTGGTMTPNHTLTGALDELRVFHGIRSVEQQSLYGRKSIYARDDLVLYYKFNEPTGSFGSTASDSINRIILDSSGNSLHSYIDSVGYSANLRLTGTNVTNPMSFERLDLSPVLFPGYNDLTLLNTDLLSSATYYDSKNPNLITKLVPPHYLDEGQAYEGFSDVDGTIGDPYEGTGAPGQGSMGSAQLFASLLYTYAKFFDELKLYTDAFGRVLSVNYDSVDTVPDQFLLLLADHYGISLPGLFSNSEISQFIDPDDITHDIGVSDASLRYVQNQMLRRIMSSIRDVIDSKGTIHSIKAFMRAMGIDPDNSMRIREFGGPTQSSLAHLRERKTDVTSMLSLPTTASLTSAFLSGTRSEPAHTFPASQGTHINGSAVFPVLGGGFVTKSVSLSTNASDGLFTSGSWAYEGFYKFPLGGATSISTHSLARMCVTGTATASSGVGVIANLIATSASINIVDVPALRLYVRSGQSSSLDASPMLTMEITGVNMFDGGHWHVAFGRRRNDDMGVSVSSSYFLHAAKYAVGENEINHFTESFFKESIPLQNALQNASSLYNVSGTYVALGTQSFSQGASASNYAFLNDTTNVPAEARVVLFDGLVGHMRFWSKALDETELLEHARNVRSLGVNTPRTNFNFVTTLTGSFGRLRFDATTDMPDEDRVASSAGVLRVFDFSRNELHMNAAGYPDGVTPVVIEMFDVNHLSTVIDEATTTEKVRVRSFLEYNNVKESQIAVVAPLYQIPRSERPNDDTRFSIDFSVTDALNRDIISMFSTLDEFDDALGAPELVFAGEYPGLRELRDVYFNRLDGKLNVRSFQEFYRWIDTSIGSFIEQLIPRKTKFLGMNFVVENHLLERPKLEYLNASDMYLGEVHRLEKSVILLRLIAGSVKKY